MKLEDNDMRKFVLLLALVMFLGVPLCLAADTMPQMRVVEPTVAEHGDLVKVTGENLDRANVAALYLTDGKNDTRVVVVEQSPTEIVFKVPTDVACGRRALMVLTTGSTPKLIEEPVKVTIE
jgi:hypothetical protein